MRTFLYRLLQWTWGLPQTLAGLVVYLLSPGCRTGYHGSVVTEWSRRGGLSLGMFVFVPRGSGSGTWFWVHEYGHTIQSLMLGPLYLLLVGLPSLVWGCHPRFTKRWRHGQVPYDSVYPENWATRLGERVTGQNVHLL